MKSLAASAVMGLTAFLALGQPLSAQGLSAPPAAADPSNQIRPGGGGSGGGAQPAAGPGKVVASIRPEETIRLFKDVGYSKVELFKYEQETHAKAYIDGTETTVWHENCKNGACETLWFMVNFGKQEVDTDYINSYNSSSYYSKMFLNNTGSLIMTMGAPLVAGVSEEHVRFLGSFWIKVYKAALEYKPPQAQ